MLSFNSIQFARLAVGLHLQEGAELAIFSRVVGARRPLGWAGRAASWPLGQLAKGPAACPVGRLVSEKMIQ